MNRREIIAEAISIIFLILVTIWGCFCMIHGMHVENIYETVIGCTFWLYGLIMMKIRDMARDVDAITTLAALIGLNAICTSAAEHEEDENDGCVD